MKIFMSLMALIGIVTVLGVVVIAVIETKRMERSKPSILSKTPEEQGNKSQKKT